MNARRPTQTVERPWLRRIARLLMLAQAIYPLAGIAPAHAQSQFPLSPSANASAGQRPIVDAAQNGVPIVHIAPPSAAGVSRNRYAQFNAGSNGLILNNSSGNVQSQLGGWISGNMQLGPTPARVILNEVTSAGTGPSQLKGFIEVAGQRADIVIANPNGLACDGCGFLNTHGRATLTTGTPQFDSRGGLTGFNVGRGQIGIGSGGLNATNLEQLDLIARGLVIEGEVWATNLQAVIGANQVLYGTLSATPKVGVDAAPRFAIDIKALGGMYANQIYLIATDQGLGVNSTGRIAALNGSLSLSANGDLSLKDTYAKRDVQLASTADTTLSGQTQSKGSTRIRSTGSFTQQGTLDSVGSLGVSAGSFDNGGLIVQRSSGTGAQGAQIDAAGRLGNTGTIQSAGDLSLSAAQIGDTGGQQLAAGNLTLGARSIRLSGTLLGSDARLAITATDGDVSLTNATVNAAGSLIAIASGGLSNAGGLIRSSQDLTLQAANVANRDGTVLASGALRVSTPGLLDNTGGKLLGSASVELNAGSLSNDASAANQAVIASDRATRVVTAGAQGLSNKGGVVSGKTLLDIDTRGHALGNAQGTLVSDDALRLKGGSLVNANGLIVSRATTDLAAVLSLDVGALDNRQGLIDAGATLQLNASGSLQNARGTVQSGTNANAAAGQGSLTLQSASVDNTAGQILSRDALQIGTGTLTNDNQGVIASIAATAALQTAALSNRSGLISSAAGTRIGSQAVDNAAGEVSSAAALALDTHGQALDNSGGRITAQGAVTLRAGAIANNASAADATRAALIASNSSVTIDAASLANRGSTVSSAGALDVNLRTGALDNALGNLASGTQLSLNAGRVGNQAGRIVADRTVQIDATHVDNSGGVVSAANTSRCRARVESTTRGARSTATGR